jgi:hypothetical protein
MSESASNSPADLNVGVDLTSKRRNEGSARDALEPFTYSGTPSMLAAVQESDSNAGSARKIAGRRAHACGSFKSISNPLNSSSVCPAVCARTPSVAQLIVTETPSPINRARPGVRERMGTRSGWLFADFLRVPGATRRILSSRTCRPRAGSAQSRAENWQIAMSSNRIGYPYRYGSASACWGIKILV